jgi:hypothetical protein
LEHSNEVELFIRKEVMEWKVKKGREWKKENGGRMGEKVEGIKIRALP